MSTPLELSIDGASNRRPDNRHHGDAHHTLDDQSQAFHPASPTADVSEQRTWRPRSRAGRQAGDKDATGRRCIEQISMSGAVDCDHDTRLNHTSFQAIAMMPPSNWAAAKVHDVIDDKGDDPNPKVTHWRFTADESSTREGTIARSERRR